VNDVGLKIAILKAGNRHRLAMRLGVSDEVVHPWVQVPRSRLLQVARTMHIRPSALRPDIMRRRQERRR
jgi:DNA-binding transcriptional regulator YdaS (Cro superfamily)